MPNILIVEDDKTIAEALKFAIEYEGFNVNGLPLVVRRCIILNTIK